MTKEGDPYQILFHYRPGAHAIQELLQNSKNAPGFVKYSEHRVNEDGERIIGLPHTADWWPAQEVSGAFGTVTRVIIWKAWLMAAWLIEKLCVTS
jgi:hypothetical protein